MAEILLGGDPQAKKAEERAKARLTLRYIANQYLQRQEIQLRPNSLRDVKRYLLKNFRPLHHMPIHKVTRRDIAVVLNDLAVKAPTQHGVVRPCLQCLVGPGAKVCLTATTLLKALTVQPRLRPATACYRMPSWPTFGRAAATMLSAVS